MYSTVHGAGGVLSGVGGSQASLTGQNRSFRPALENSYSQGDGSSGLGHCCSVAPCKLLAVTTISCLHPSGLECSGFIAQACVCSRGSREGSGLCCGHVVVSVHGASAPREGGISGRGLLETWGGLGQVGG